MVLVVMGQRGRTPQLTAHVRHVRDVTPVRPRAANAWRSYCVCAFIGKTSNQQHASRSFRLALLSWCRRCVVGSITGGGPSAALAMQVQQASRQALSARPGASRSSLLVQVCGWAGECMGHSQSPALLRLAPACVWRGQLGAQQHRRAFTSQVDVHAALHPQPLACGAWHPYTPRPLAGGG